MLLCVHNNIVLFYVGEVSCFKSVNTIDYNM